MQRASPVGERQGGSGSVIRWARFPRWLRATALAWSVAIVVPWLAVTSGLRPNTNPDTRTVAALLATNALCTVFAGVALAVGRATRRHVLQMSLVGAGAGAVAFFTLSTGSPGSADDPSAALGIVVILPPLWLATVLILLVGVASGTGLRGLFRRVVSR